MKKILEKLKGSSAHFIIWSVFLVYETIIVGLVFNLFENPWTYIFHYTVIIVFFYFFSDLGLLWSLRTKAHVFWRLPLIIGISLAAYIFFQYVVDLLLIYMKVITIKDDYPLNRQFILRNLFRGIYFMFFSIAYFIFKKTQMEKREKDLLKQLHLQNIIKQQKTEQELVESRNAILKAQINPHFLFNTLDFIYHTMSTNVPVASDAVIHLSRMMRFAIDSDHMGEVISLGAEIKHVETLFSLYRLRNSKTEITLDYAPEINALLLIPLVLLTLAENMIKHGDFSDTNHQAVIEIFYKEDVLTIITRNPPSNSTNTPSGKLGLDNVRKRLQYKYGEDVSLEHAIVNGVFILKLTIPAISKNGVEKEVHYDFLSVG